jgi:type II secretory pathway component GspD/PulD (secretin)
MSFGVMANECAELSKCVEYVSKLTGKKYLYDARSVKGGLQASSNTEITVENADTLFTYILDLNGYARVPTAEKDTYLIIESRDIRYQPLPTINVDAQSPPKIPQNYDYYMMSFKFKNFSHGQLREASNSLRPFMSRYARTIELKGTGILTIQENAAKLNKAYEMIKSFDRELSKEELKSYNEQEVERKEDRKEEKNEKHHKKLEEKSDKKDDKNKN